MERHVKERLIGATILLVLVVLLVPEFLSGPKAPPPAPPASLPAPVHTYTVDLNDPSRATLQEPDSDAANAPTATAASSVPTDPSVATEPSAPPSGSPSTPPQSQAPIESAPITPTETVGPGSERSPHSTSLVSSPEQAPVSSGSARVVTGRHPGAKGAWSVQLGSFASKPNAEKLAKLLEGKGYAVLVAPIGVGSAARYRVRIGPLADREAAVRMIGKLQSQGHPATLVPPG